MPVSAEVLYFCLGALTGLMCGGLLWYSISESV